MTQPLTTQRAEAYRDALAARNRGPIAFVAVTPNEECPGVHAALGIAVANERGYMPVPLGWAAFETWEAAESNVDELNKHLGLDRMEGLKIIASTMGGMRYVRNPRHA